MKKQLFLIPFLLFGLFSFNMSEPEADVFTSSELVWCGFDFSKVKCIGSEGFTNPTEIKDRFFESWNNLVLAESDKYDVKKFYGKESQINDLSVVADRNELPEVDELVINEPYALAAGELTNIIKDYDLAEVNEGLGLVYVVESLNKTKQIAVVNVVFFDIATKDVLWTKKYEAKPGGFGFRNYWAAAFRKTMEVSGKDFQKEAKKANKK